MNTNDILGTVIVGAVAMKLLDNDDEHHHGHKKGKKTKSSGLLDMNNKNSLF